MQLGLAFFHGWGLDAQFWQPLAARLNQYPHAFFDAGYFGPPQTPHFAAADRWVAVGHSLGFARALQSPPPHGWAAMVSVAGFSHFCAPPVDGAAPPGQPRRVVERMVRAYAREPQAVLADFLARCGLADRMPLPDAVRNDTRLAADLALLLDIDVQAQLTASTALTTLPTPVLALAARDDTVVTAALTEATFAQRPHTRLVWCAQGGHALGRASAHVCAAAIADFLETV
jgi:pimeloyl-[acyl-carrier protein] methyl ester esterase